MPDVHAKITFSSLSQAHLNAIKAFIQAQPASRITDFLIERLPSTATTITVAGPDAQFGLGLMATSATALLGQSVVSVSITPQASGIRTANEV